MTLPRRQSRRRESPSVTMTKTRMSRNRKSSSSTNDSGLRKRRRRETRTKTKRKAYKRRFVESPSSRRRRRRCCYCGFVEAPVIGRHRIPLTAMAIGRRRQRRHWGIWFLRRLLLIVFAAVGVSVAELFLMEDFFYRYCLKKKLSMQWRCFNFLK